MLFQLRPVVSKALIEEQLTHEEIFQYYLNQPVQYQRLFRASATRKDRVETAGFFYKNGRIYYKDFNGLSGDCYKVIKDKFGYTSYFEVFKRICQDFGLIDPTTKTTKAQKQITVINKRVEKPPTDIKIRKRPWDKHDLAYWGQYGISVEILDKFRVFPVQHLFLNGSMVYTYSNANPYYAYYFGKKQNGQARMKIYKPMEKARGLNGFYSNCSVVSGLKELPSEGEFLIWTKSHKDVMGWAVLGIPAIAPQTEGQMPRKSLLDSLRPRFPVILSNMDYEKFSREENAWVLDRAGIKFAAQLRKEYGLPALMLRGLQSKDITDLLARYGRTKVLSLINANINEISESITKQARRFQP